ncbi:MAG: hypothetical protein L0387_42370 [Acidobacteria bacterium]|nr:hypothetical protein [Acidobacteriota bacterium]
MTTKVIDPGAIVAITIPSISLYKWTSSGSKWELAVRVPLGLRMLEIGVFFQSLDDFVVVYAAVSGKYLRGILFNQETADHVTVQIDHENTYVPFQSIPQCTVTCSTTGESRSGMGACIDCPGPRGTVRICC